MDRDARVCAETLCRKTCPRLQLVLTGDPALFAIVRLSLIVSLSAVLLAALIGLPLGAWLALSRFPRPRRHCRRPQRADGTPAGRRWLVVYLLLSRSGPLGSWGILFTPQAMIIAQTILIAPIIAALARQTIEDLWLEYRDELAAMNVGTLGRVATLLWDGASACSPRCSPASAAPPRKSAPSSSSAAISTASPAP